MRDLPIIWLTAVVVPLVVQGCAVNQVFECNRLIAIANQVTTETYLLTEEQNSEDPLIWLEAADRLDDAATQMAAIELSDAQLQTYQTGFVQMYRAIAQATRAYAKSYQNLDREGVDAARAQLEQAVKNEADLVNGINNYCMSATN